MTTVQKTVDISRSQMSVQELLHLVDEGIEILLTDGNNPLARLVPIAQQNVPRIAGLHQGEIWTSNDFDAPLPDFGEDRNVRSHFGEERSETIIQRLE
ncbi:MULTISPECIES: type II toxin-antitoxin system Phd/YefM family antitoxin [Planktothrix]|jgi:antitoxin (DNA-binding transcriptional repressor) of toxin-antitoxin stability system|uniref:Prevent-host-death protein n=2 Tax=Planktothrix TaxID=54304 RepID=A0A4V0XV00_PLAAG|nr:MULTISPECIES: hypothetical protein [Planktothrix]CAD5945281.1 hypothetical protein NO108_02569 [Planktothrix rubescens]CAC5344698.1 Antitoxin of toxin-antitoxin stability system (modular protein) [Planktothrix rubescens NIVA-CYA 18]CAD0220579.1 conserved hypothetical protein [Planktothrix agardhii]CAD5921214.1 hypothetical protein PCC7821_00668 [Planktothrix rubescens NIVA-CYA 18]CAD5970629.1 hypothetical protein NO758_03742 [Planktothrix agardhii]